MGTGCLICLRKVSEENGDKTWLDFVIGLIKLLVSNDSSVEERLNSPDCHQFCPKCSNLFEEIKQLQWQVMQLDKQIKGRIRIVKKLIVQSKK